MTTIIFILCFAALLVLVVGGLCKTAHDSDEQIDRWIHEKEKNERK